jgi:hypothetical protein
MTIQKSTQSKGNVATTQIWIHSGNAHFASIDNKMNGRFVSVELFERLKSEGKAYSNDDETNFWFATSIQKKHKYSHIKKQ